ncbi:hypothetical protein SD457_08845 [Coprobacillaceae bacterium CR2/5/TPMF4]|nr:hypothetical protein SD457_08845 [Coprobacillaceae bacterium CR2/5/TPMF4]
MPIIHIGNGRLNQLIGYETQKQTLRNNTEAFLAGKKLTMFYYTVIVELENLVVLKLY